MSFAGKGMGLEIMLREIKLRKISITYFPSRVESKQKKKKDAPKEEWKLLDERNALGREEGGRRRDGSG